MDSKSRKRNVNENSNFNRLDSQLKNLTIVLWCISGASVISMCLAIVATILVIFSH